MSHINRLLEEEEFKFELVTCLECEVWEAIRLRDIDVLTRLSAPDYVAINKQGILEFLEVVEELRRSTLASYI